MLPDCLILGELINLWSPSLTFLAFPAIRSPVLGRAEVTSHAAFDVLFLPIDPSIVQEIRMSWRGQAVPGLLNLMPRNREAP